MLFQVNKYLKKIKYKNSVHYIKNAIDKILKDYTVSKLTTGDLSEYYGYNIFNNKTNYELVYRVEYQEDKIIIVIMAGTRELL